MEWAVDTALSYSLPELRIEHVCKQKRTGDRFLMECMCLRVSYLSFFLSFFQYELSTRFLNVNIVGSCRRYKILQGHTWVVYACYIVYGYVYVPD
jgi:hypothetical protein